MSTITQTKTKPPKTINKNLEEATASGDLDTVLKNVKKIDTTCAYEKCKTRTADFAISCKYCNLRFCTTHGLPEIHGCGEAVRRDEKRQYLHPQTKLSERKHSQASQKLQLKLKQMQQERKSKQGFRDKDNRK